MRHWLLFSIVITSREKKDTIRYFIKQKAIMAREHILQKLGILC